jgi:glucose-1-phosphate thymidylyltransferase
MTQVTTKQLLPVYDKPMIYYPLSVMMLAGIRDILIIIKPEDQHLFERLLGNGSQWGISIKYQIQLSPRGLPEAFILGREFIGDDQVMMILGDNIFYGSGLIDFLNKTMMQGDGGRILTFQVKDPERFGVVNFGEDGSVIGMEEKPSKPLSDWAMAGMYVFDADVVEKSARLKPSQRGELEMVDLLQLYLDEGRMHAARSPRGFAWLDTGTPTAMMQASQYIQIIEARQGMKIACLEEIAYKRGFIDLAQLKALVETMNGNEYACYLRDIVKEAAHG